MTPQQPATGDGYASGELFTMPDAPQVRGVPAAPRDAAANDAALAGDGYGWLAELLATMLPATDPPTCPECERPQVLPASAPVLWSCPDCHPEEAR